MSHWTDLKLVKPRVLDAARARAATKNNVDHYFDQLNTVLTNFNFTIKPELIYNIDEKGINLNHKPTNIVELEIQNPQAVTSGRSSTITIIAGRNALIFHHFMSSQVSG